MKRPIGILHTLQLFHLLKGVDAPAPEPEPETSVDTTETHIIAPGFLFKETVDWLRWRGYRVVATSTPGMAVGGVVFGKKNQPAMVAVVGDILEYDGEIVTIMES